MLLKNYKC